MIDQPQCSKKTDDHDKAGADDCEEHFGHDALSGKLHLSPGVELSIALHKCLAVPQRFAESSEGDKFLGICPTSIGMTSRVFLDNRANPTDRSCAEADDLFSAVLVS